MILMTRMSRLFCLPTVMLWVGFYVFGGSLLEATVRLNEIVASNGSLIADEDGDFEDWIELHNPGDATVELSGWGLSDNESRPFKWEFPEGVVLEPGAFLLIWASGKDRTNPSHTLHTNFSISSSGEEVLLTRPDGSQADYIPPKELLRDVSLGRVPGEGESWYYFANPTPGSANTALAYVDIAPVPQFSVAAGFYEEGFTLDVEADDGTVIHYTLDGTIPDETSPVWDGSLWIGAAGNDPLLALVPTTPPVDFEAIDTDRIARLATEGIRWFPPQSVERATIVRALALKPDYLPRPPVAATYFVQPSRENGFSLPVVSLMADPDDFFQPEHGIYVAGNLFQNTHQNRPWHSPANYRQRGREWEKIVHVEFFGPDGRLWLSQAAGARIHGGATRSFAQKSLRLYARQDYNESRFRHPLFAGLEDDMFNRLLLRNAGNDWVRTLFRDAAIQASVRHLNFDTQAYQPTVVFLNGEYWGIHNLRERYDRHYLLRRYGVDPDDLDLLTGINSVKEGSSDHYLELLGYVAGSNPVEESFLEEVERRVDLENFIDYFLAQIFCGNTDWPLNNIDFWRVRKPFDPQAPEGHDGRWRWLMYDTDFGFGFANDGAHNTLETARRHLLFDTLLENPEFRRRFVVRFSDQLNTAFQPLRLEALIEAMAGQIRNEIPFHSARWGQPASKVHWEAHVEEMIDFTNGRRDHLWEHLRTGLGLESAAKLEITSIPAAEKSIEVNTLGTIQQPFGAGSADGEFFWQGRYFPDFPVRLKARDLPGYRFLGWRVKLLAEPVDTVSAVGNTENTDEGHLYPDALLYLNLSGDTRVEAVYDVIAEHELHYWSFNAETLAADFSRGGADLRVVPGPETEVTFATGQGFVGENARFGAEAGAHLRLNNPPGTTVQLAAPTTGYSNIRLSYETRRSGQGAGVQEISWSGDGGASWTSHATLAVVNAEPQMLMVDFSNVDAAVHNPDFAVRITFTEGSGSSAGNNRFDNIVVEGDSLEPVLLEEPIDVATAAGGSATLMARVDGLVDYEYQWLHNGLVMSGATSPRLEIPMVRKSDEGVYVLRIEGPAGAVFTEPVLLSVVRPADLINLSSRAPSLAGAGRVIAGFVLAGSEPRTLLLTGRGPSLADFGLSGLLERPRLILFDGAEEIARNTGWRDHPDAGLIEASGFGPNRDEEAALLAELQPGRPYTVHLVGDDGGTGLSLAELFDLDLLADGEGDARLANLSIRGRITAGANILIAGFVVEANGPERTVLIRGIGPGLADFGVADHLPDPWIRVFDHQAGAFVAENRSWREQSAEAVARIEATPFAPGREDEAALLLTLAPGAYTVHLRDTENRPGIGLVEVYALPW
ncbi:MAG: hypothetical protein EA425_05365 [Puniceicoccaceae bacterium]|nr:MAG: hypothetical protein EA425_05365 [Puniceicoccaceae bacterium]